MPDEEALAEDLRAMLLTLAEALRDKGVKTVSTRRLQLAVCPNAKGSSLFWVTPHAFHWYIGTWSGRLLRVDRCPDFAELILELSDCQRVGQLEAALEAHKELLEEIPESQIDGMFLLFTADQSAYPVEVTTDVLRNGLLATGFQIRDRSQNCFVVTDPMCADEVAAVLVTQFQNHWYVRTPSGRVIGCDDLVILELIHELFRSGMQPALQITEDIVAGYSVRECSDDFAKRIAESANWPPR